MPNITPGLSRSASRWAFQVSSSLGATLIAALIIHALPRPAPAAVAPAVELTSGGKFAARVASAQAYDGLDKMPLPHVDAPPAIPAAFLTAPPADLARDDAATRQSLDARSGGRDRAKPKAVRPPLRAEARRPILPVDAAPAAPLAGASMAITAAAPDDGLFHKVVSTTGRALTITASAGGSLLSRLIP